MTIDGELWITDASILTNDPIHIRPEDERLDEDLPRLERRDGKPTVIWRSLSAPEGFPCRFERIGVGAGEWDALHQRTAASGPFNTALSARVARGSTSIGFSGGQRFAFDANGTLAVETRDREGRDRFLMEDLGISATLVARLPDDRPLDA